MAAKKTQTVAVVTIWETNRVLVFATEGAAAAWLREQWYRRDGGTRRAQCWSGEDWAGASLDLRTVRQ